MATSKKSKVQTDGELFMSLRADLLSAKRALVAEVAATRIAMETKRKAYEAYSKAKADYKRLVLGPIWNEGHPVVHHNCRSSANPYLAKKCKPENESEFDAFED